MKYFFPFLVISSIVWSLNSFDNNFKHELTIPANRFVNLVGRRYYHIVRLSEAMNVFKKVQEDLEYNAISLNKEQLFNFKKIELFKHPGIRNSFAQMQQENTLIPLFLVWDDFMSFKCLNDPIFIEEFTKEVFIVSSHLLQSSKIHQKDSDESVIEGTLTLDQLLNLIDLYIDQFINNYHYRPLKTTQENLADVAPKVNMDEVALRYYYIKRLYNPISVLKLLHVQHLPQPLFIKTVFHHPAIVAAVQDITVHGSLQHLSVLYQAIEHFKYIEDIVLIHEFALLILYLYSEIIDSINYPSIPARNTKNLFEKLQDAPLEEILDAVNLIAEELPAALQNYEFNSKLTWRQWLRKYWWAPPVIVATLVVKIIILHATYSKPSPVTAE